jgi:hypothetical protein
MGRGAAFGNAVLGRKPAETETRASCSSQVMSVDIAWISERRLEVAQAMRKAVFHDRKLSSAKRSGSKNGEARN